MKATDSPIIVKQFFKLDSLSVWDAITNHQLMIQWYFNNIPDFKAEVGFKTQFNVKAPSRDFLHIWEVTNVIPLKKITYNWTFKDIKGSSDVTFELIEQNDGTLLRVSNVVIEDFNDNIPEFKSESCLMGWKYFINEQLVSFLSK